MVARPARLAGKALAWLALLAGLVVLLFWIAAAIPRNPGWREADRGIAAFIETNGVHTGIIMPVVSEWHDWRTAFPSAARPGVTHIAVGWGEKEIFLDTPTWGDLHYSTALRIAIEGGDGLLRVGHYRNPAPGEYLRPLTLRPEEYRRIVAAIEAALPPLEPGAIRRSYTGFQPGDVHYDALGRYTLAHTCNQWVADVLAAAGIRVGWWTPLAGGVTRWFPLEAA